MGKNLHFIKLLYKLPIPFHRPKTLLFQLLYFSCHPFTLTDYQCITVNPPVFPFHTPFTLGISHYTLTNSQ